MRFAWRQGALYVEDGVPVPPRQVVTPAGELVQAAPRVATAPLVCMFCQSPIPVGVSYWRVRLEAACGQCVRGEEEAS